MEVSVSNLDRPGPLHTCDQDSDRFGVRGQTRSLAGYPEGPLVPSKDVLQEINIFTVVIDSHLNEKGDIFLSNWKSKDLPLVARKPSSELGPSQPGLTQNPEGGKSGGVWMFYPNFRPS